MTQESLKHLYQLQHVAVKPYAMPFGPELMAMRWQPGFHCLNTGEIFTDFPEQAAFVDTEWLVKANGSAPIAGLYSDPAFNLGPDKELNPVVKRPFSVQIIGLSGKSYIWFQPEDYSDATKLQLCSIGPHCTTMVVHNIAADRPLFKEVYENPQQINFFCTMSAHLLCAGVSDQQSWSYREGHIGPRAGGLKNLIDVYNFWAFTPFPEVLEFSAKRGETKIESKKIRDIFLNGQIKQVYTMLSELVQYGMEDTNKVVAIFRNLYPAWLNALPAKESQYAYLKRAHVNYSVPSYFKEWFITTELKYRAISKQITALIEANNKTQLNKFKGEIDAAIDHDLKPGPEFYTKTGKLKKQWNYLYLLQQELNPDVQAVINKWESKYPAGSWKLDKEGIPDWYVKTNHSSDSPICQLLLDPQYTHIVGESAYITYDKVKKFVYYIGPEQIKITSPKKGLNTKDNCGSILAKDFIDLWDEGVLFTEGPEAQEIVKLMSSISYWTSVRKRLACICHGL